MSSQILLVVLTLGTICAANPTGSDDSGCAQSQPCYTAAGIANSAANVAGYYAPNSFLSIYGTNLSYVTGSLGLGDLIGGNLPADGVIQGTEVGVLIGNVPSYVFYVSPNQVNVLIPTYLIPGPVTLQLENRSVYGPPIQITLTAAAPAMFPLDASNVLATHGNGPVVTPASPAQPGEIVILWATGLGFTVPALAPGEIPAAAAWLADLPDFEVQLNGVAVDPHSIQYAGVAPGFAGLYQINVQLPADCPSNPEIRIGFGPGSNPNLSPAQRFLPVE
jgi:uncharacterized protein (TIGR03437 family)